MGEIWKYTLKGLRDALQERKISASEAVEAACSRIEVTEPFIQALLARNEDKAREEARLMDADGPDPTRPLWGVPVTVKDALSTSGLPTTAASRILEGFTPFFDAYAVKKLKEAGAIVLAKTNMDEFAMGSATENSAYASTRNPWNQQHVPGGSSGGAAASVAAGQCFAALGSDTGGSIRQPAAFCGCVGLKPTYGLVSRYGLFAFGSSLDQIGPLARTVEDCAIVLGVIAGHDPRDNTSARRPAEDYAAALQGTRSLKGVRIGKPEAFFSAGLADEVRDACEHALESAAQAGAEIVNIELPDPSVATAAYYIIAMAEASSNLARYDGVRYGRRAPGVTTLDELYTRSRTQGFGAEVKRRIMLGSYVLSAGYYDAYFRKAAQVRRLIRDAYLDALASCDALYLPVAPSTAWKLGSHAEDPLAAYLMDAFTLPVNLAGLPGLSLPVGLGSQTGLPVGIQLIGAPFGEKKLLGLGKAFEDLLPGIGWPSIG